MKLLSVHWVLDRDYLDICYGNVDDNAMTTALIKLSTPYQLVHWRNRLFTEGFSASDDEDAIYFIVGSVGFCRNIDKVLGDRVDMSRVFCLFPNEVMHYSRYIHMVEPEIRVNECGFMLPLGEMMNLGDKRLKDLTGYGAGVFLKCDYGLKSAESEFIEWGNLARWFNYTETHTGCGRNSLFWLFPKKHIKKEFRFAIIDGAVVTGTQYMDFTLSGIEPSLSPDYPVEAKFIAEAVSKQLKITDDAYILDVAEVNGEYQLIECNAISSSGWYAMDHVTLCKSINKKIVSIAMEFFE